ncbi:tyrosine-type recombinase/integrase [Cellulomonas taurus]|uniref:tyrosine-type recombinase/integrase n=1 Tax=Cellulomonas taurus TaxID=2729175 RepID=UPI00145EC6E0|nr:site-specific integrase [Cellulomonas taurus]
MSERWFDEQLHQRASSLGVIRRRLDNTILPALGERPLSAIDRGVVQQAVTGWSRELAPSTVRVTYVYLAGIFSLAVDERRLTASPCRKINLPAVEREPVIPMAVAKVQDLTNALWRPYQRMAVLAAATGMRSGELRGLTWDRITPAPGGAQLRVDRQMTSTVSSAPAWGPLKTTYSLRVISIGTATLEALGDRGTGLVLTTGTGNAITRGMASTAWRAAAAKIGLDEGTGWHELRHFHASMLIAQGASPVAVAHRLGHKDATETLTTYAHLWPDDDEKMRDASDGVIHLPAA